jgi:hypothetical protein
MTTNSPHFISGQVRFRGNDNDRYPFNYLEMIDSIFGKKIIPWKSAAAV